MTTYLLDPSTATRPATRTASTPSRTGLFVREFLRNPLTTASLVPSSVALAAAMIPDAREFPVVLELGPGTGSFTRALQHRRRRPDRHLGIELNPVLADTLAADYPAVEVITAPVVALTDILNAERLYGQVDLIVSGLPWQAFSGPAGERLIPDIAGALAPGGTFTQFTYSWTRWAPPGRRQLADLRRNFDQVTVAGPIWANFPPATVYTCTQPVQS